MFFIKVHNSEKRININHIESFDIHRSNPFWFKVHRNLEYEEAEKEANKLHGVFAMLSTTKREIDKPRFRSETEIEEYAWIKYNVNPDLYDTNKGDLIYEGTLEECKQYIQEQQNLLEMRYWLSHLFAGILGGLVTLVIT